MVNKQDRKEQWQSAVALHVTARGTRPRLVLGKQPGIWLFAHFVAADLTLAFQVMEFIVCLV